MGKSGRHLRNESDPLLGLYGSAIAASEGHGALYGGSFEKSTPSPHKSSSMKEQYEDPDQTMKGYRVHKVSYTAGNHVQILFQMYGSAFPNVFPFVLVNVMWGLVVYYLKEHHKIDLTFHSSTGHSFMGLLVSFLIVSRSQISYGRFMSFRTHLATQYRLCRSISQLTCTYTMTNQTQGARQWRHEVCFKTIKMLRVTMDALHWSSTSRDKWEEEYFKYQARDAEKGDDHGASDHFFNARKLSHGRRSNIDEIFRAPITNCHLLSQTIMTHPDYLGYKMPVNEYRDLVLMVASFQEAFHAFRVLIFTPYPFPLVQMTRAFLFFWVYTLPLVLLKDYRLWNALLIVCLVSFGFIGIEYVSMALDDPFGDDTNDVDEHGMALLTYEDIYLTLYRTDGPAAAFELRDRVLNRYKQGRGIDCYRDDMKGTEIWEPLYFPEPETPKRRPPRPPTGHEKKVSIDLEAADSETSESSKNV
ncbi:unnamed protein product [Cylindrotheca closterium]|uniref:Bestrophin homolog n=1 Tax=Cylindrotheca closterium TaxID=2856 RepID=A0AAD2CCL9_9STRA|nr:unnamed protein product [Cylindrotheca closterium]